MINLPKSILIGVMILVTVCFTAASLYTRTLMTEKRSELSLYEARREDLMAQERGLQDLIVRFNATLSEDLTKQATLARILIKTIETKQAAEEKSNQTQSSTSIVNTTVISAPPSAPVQINPPQQAPRVTRAS